MGATFAYFSVTGNTNATTNVEATAKDPGVVTVSKEKDVSAEIEAELMSKPTDENDDYVYILNDNTAEKVTTKSAPEKSKIKFATIQATSDEEGNFTCSGKITVTTTMEGGTLPTETAYIKFDDVSGLTNLSTYTNDTALTTTPIEINFESLPVKKDTNLDIQGVVYIVNKYNTQQNLSDANSIANKKIKVSVDVTITKCEVA